jgi:predicted Zn-dependent peptidase
MRVVLLPMTSVPTIDARIVFDAGTADELANRRGAALIAGYALSWDAADPEAQQAKTLLTAAGGSVIPDVTRDRTAFAVRGLDMHLDLLLTALQRFVVRGTYGYGAALAAEVVRSAAKKLEDDGPLTDAWRAALYGPTHPYVRESVLRYVAPDLGLVDAEQFRAAHLTPDHATLVIAGHFDRELADRWIDYLFSDWKGVGETPVSTPAAASPGFFARVDDAEDARVQILLPAKGGGHAARLVAAQMLDDIATDVRHQLAASYEVGALVDESRLSNTYEIGGYIDAGKTVEALQLIASRIAALAVADDAIASAFVLARHRVIERLQAVTGSADGLAARVQHDVALGRPPMSDLATAAAVRALTIDAMSSAFADLDLAHAIVSLIGPRAVIDGAARLLHATPTYVEAAKPSTAASIVSDSEIGVLVSAARADLEHHHAAVAESGFTYSLTAGYTTGSIVTSSTTASGVSPPITEAGAGVTVSCDLGRRLATHIDQARLAVGIHIAIGDLSSTGPPATMPAYTLIPFDFDAFGRVMLFGRLWLAGYAGLHADSLSQNGIDATSFGMSIGAELGIDPLRIGDYRLGIYGRVENELVGDLDYTATTLGIEFGR